MSPDWNLVLAAFLVSLPVSWTPGPNNIICTAIGARHGWRQAVPYSLGVGVGFPVLLGSVGIGLGTVIRLYPSIQTAAQWIGVAFLVYLAYRLATAPLADPADPNPHQSQVKKSVPGFWYAVFFQWANPKAVSFCFSLISLYTRPDALWIDLSLLMLISVFISVSSTLTWAVTGNVISKFLHTPKHHRLFNGCMATLLLLSALIILLPQ